jgi:hypothetical protein
MPTAPGQSLTGGLAIYTPSGRGSRPATPTDRWARRAGSAGVTAPDAMQACPRRDANGWRRLAALVRGAPTGRATRPRRTTDKQRPRSRANHPAAHASLSRGLPRRLARAAPFRHPSRARPLSAPVASAVLLRVAWRSAWVISSSSRPRGFLGFRGLFFGWFRVGFRGGWMDMCIKKNRCTVYVR